MTPAQLLDKALIVKELRRLATLPALAPRSAELTVLHQDLAGSHQLDRWAEVDLVQTYVRPESVRAVGGRPSGRHDRLLEAALGVLVFVPLLITWFGLREAVRAYGELAKEDPDQATRPFLQQWQTGFGGHLSSLGRFENVALMAVLLIALLVALSVWHGRVRVRTEHHEETQEAEEEKLLAELASVLTRAQMLLAPHRAASPQQFTAELTKAAQTMQLVTQKAEQSHKALSGATASVSQAIDALRQATQSLTTEVPKLGDAANRIDTTLRDGTQETVKAGQANARAARGIADHVKAAGDTVEASLKALVAAQQSLVLKSESVAKATEQASQALVTSTGRTGDAVDGMREATERWDAAAAHWQDAAARLDARMDTLAGALPALASPASAPGARTTGYDPGGAHGTYGSTNGGAHGGTFGPPNAGAYGTGTGAHAANGGTYGADTGAGAHNANGARTEGSSFPGPSRPGDPPLDPALDTPLDAPTTRLPPPGPRDGGAA
ncbi:hypothetical protein ABZS76_06480 [Streptomyces sp. NPDC005562]|uniref:hypothetical protein n=1 Tax=unclassified Streptomyces TaxID=2593676 RepID=UPI0033A469F8